MRVGLIGYFGVGAFSDDLIEWVTRQLLLEVNPDITFDSTILSRGPAGSDPDYLNSFDLLVHCGGSLLGKCTHYPIHNIAQWHDKVQTPLAVFGIGYRYEPDKEPLTPVMRERIRLLFDKSEVVSVRGEYTVKHLEENRVDTSCIDSLGDPVMACSLKLNRRPRYLMGNVRHMPQVEVQHNTTEQVQRFMADCYDFLIDKQDQPLVLVSFRHNIPDDNDVTGAMNVKEIMDNTFQVTIATPPNYREAVKLLENAAFYYGQRLHPTIYAATQGIPFVGVEYQFDKLLDWVSTVGINNLVHTGSATLTDFIDAYRRVDANMRHLKAVFPARAKEIRKIAQRIVELA